MMVVEQTIQNSVEVDGSWVSVDVYGAPDGPAIVVVPGVMADAAAWARVAHHLDQWPTVAVLNRRGRHPSGPLTDGYGFASEVADLMAVLQTFTDVRALFGWSFGGLIALHLTNTLPVAHLIAYEPVTAPFGATALPHLQQAHEVGDLDAGVTVALSQVAGMSPQVIEQLWADEATWAELRRLGAPAYAETRAINEAPRVTRLGERATRVDLIVGARNHGHPPYGTSFEDVARLVPTADIHELDRQGHLAHLEAPEQLATLVNQLPTPVA